MPVFLVDLLPTEPKPAPTAPWKYCTPDTKPVQMRLPNYKEEHKAFWKSVVEREKLEKFQGWASDPNRPKPTFTRAEGDLSVRRLVTARSGHKFKVHQVHGHYGLRTVSLQDLINEQGGLKQQKAKKSAKKSDATPITAENT